MFVQEDRQTCNPYSRIGKCTSTVLELYLFIRLNSSNDVLHSRGTKAPTAVYVDDGGAGHGSSVSRQRQTQLQERKQTYLSTIEVFQYMKPLT